ncbi:MAG: bifunctional riboflavin kinase/FAD synthetase [Ruminococcaceae bacterium]|nr:bifunctional riboflavin kinase/FAD synthetase [Oscillospiraceae bacterium]
MKIYGNFKNEYGVPEDALICDEFFKNDLSNGCGIGLGNFDGVHRGHASLIDTLAKECSERKLLSVIYTFSNHPNKVLFKKRKTPVIMTVAQKSEIFEEKGIAASYFEYFDEEYANMPAEAFIEEYLVKKFNAKLIVVGHNYSFGEKGFGTPELLKEYGNRYGFDVIVVPPVMEDENVISSTLLRSFIRDGRMKKYRKFTGRYYSIPGEVAIGRGVGHEIGFPTANILPKEGFALPLSGVYASKTLIDGKMYNSVTNIGNNPTFEGIKDITVETHIFDYNCGLYGKNIEVFFVDMIRGECRFKNAGELIQQINCDIRTAQRILSQKNM